jgi:hypothetical protein
MKKITLWLFALFTCWQINAQVSSYGFSQSTGTYNEITGGTVLGIATNDDTSFPANPIGFSFYYNGANYTQFSVNSNGFLALGATVASSYTALTDGTSNNVVAALNGDLQGNATTGELSYQLSGTAPNQVLTVQWKSYRHYNATGDNYNFQIKLHETTNLIEVVYGTFAQNATDRTRQVGLRGASNADFNNRTTTADWSATTAGGTNAANCALTATVIPASGLTFTWTPPSCAAPGGFVASAITPTSATISWNAAVPVPSTGYEYYYSSVNTAPTGAGTPIAALTDNLTSLSVNTPYYVWLRSDCGGGTFSAWSGPFTFQTPCNPYSVPYFEGFESGYVHNATVGGCLTQATVTGTQVWTANSTFTDYNRTPRTGSYNAFLRYGNEDWLFIPIDLVAGTSYRVSLYARQDGATAANSNMAISYGVANNAASMTNSIVAATGIINGNYQEIVGDFIPATSGTYYVGIKGFMNGTPWYISLDDISIALSPTCLNPTTLAASNITSSSVNLSWVDITGSQTNFEYVIQAPGTGVPAGAGTAVTGTSVTGATLDINAAPLAANTTYEVYVRADCGGGDFSTWSGPITFKTLCNAVVAPWTYDVESAAATTNSSISDCWSSIPTANNGAFRWDVDAAGGTPSNFSTGPAGAYSGVKYFYTEASSGATGAVAELYTPLVNISALTEPTLQFYYHMRGINMGELHVDVYNGTAWVNDVDVIIGQQQAAATDPWLQKVVDLSAYTGTIQVRFRGIRGAGFESDMSIDDITFDEAPACLPVNNLTLSNITSGSVQIDWSDMSAVGQFDFEYAIQVQGTGTPTGAGVAVADITVVDTNDITATPLAPNSPYEVYVRADCGGGLYSDWVGPVNFTTECATYAAPYLELFNTFLPACWQAADNGNLVAGPATFGASGWFEDGFGNVGFTGAINYNIWLAQANDWVISPTINIPASGYELKFDAAATQYGGTNAPTTAWEADDFVEVLVSTTGYTNWTVLYTYNNTNVPAPTGTTNIIDLDAFAGQDVRFAYRAVEGATDGGADLQFFVDNFEVRLTPSLPPSCASNVVATPDAACGNFANSITWDAAVGADGYYLTIGTSTGASDVLNNVDLGNVLSYSFVGTIGTTYFYTLSPYNGVGPATSCTEMSFVTNSNGCYCVSAPTSVDGTGITNVQIVATDFPNTVATAPVYNDHTATVVDMSQGISNNVQIAFNTSFFDYNTVIWIDFNDDFNFAPSEIVYTGLSSATSPNTLNASFVMPGTAPLGQHRMRIVATDGLQTPSNPCYSASYGETADFTINIVAASCAPAAIASSTVTPDCANAQFSVAIDVTALGSGTPSITDGTTTWPIAAVGVVNVGPFADGSSVSLTVLHGSDATCNLPLGSFTYTCPAVNDDLCNALPITVNATSTGTQYNNVGATGQTSEPSAACFSQGINGSVWFSFVAPASGEVIITTDIAGATATDTEIAVYAATGVTCSDMTTLGAALGCDQDSGTTINYNSVLNLPGLTAGNTYYIQVDDYGFGTSQGSFGLQVTEVLSSDNFDANNFVAYPNPVKDIFNISYSSEISSVRIINLLGQEVISTEVNATSTQIDMSQLSSGAYIVNVTVGDTIKTIKVVKQ